MKINIIKTLNKHYMYVISRNTEAEEITGLRKDL